MNKHLHYRGLRRRKERGSGRKLKEIISENFTNLEKKIDI